MKILRALVVLALVMVIAFAVYMRGSVGDLRGPSARLAIAHSREPFDATHWANGHPVRRGWMLADMLMRHSFNGAHADSVRQILGRSNCYAVQDGWPCYELQLGERQYQLVFLLNDSKAPGHVSHVYLETAP